MLKRSTRFRIPSAVHYGNKIVQHLVRILSVSRTRPNIDLSWLTHSMPNIVSWHGFVAVTNTRIWFMPMYLWHLRGVFIIYMKFYIRRIKLKKPYNMKITYIFNICFYLCIICTSYMRIKCICKIIYSTYIIFYYIIYNISLY